MRLIKFETGYNKLSFRMSERIETAVEAYNVMLKLNTEQETSGEFDNLRFNLSLIHANKDFDINIYPEIFPGREDVIFELNVDINIHNNSSLDIKDIDTEDILGTIFKEIREHFDFYYTSYPDHVKSEIVKYYFRGY